ncbi:diguanylate cyclase domain-containing protein [Marichromatium bheemlicum]|uniref:Diguanylate cyclase n=1 Tax=Marichromatium bheemlicum TaxID=365339 RepID=A0ABX1I503_9GAMM|nr:diguanylate cyclase [Marichromatium bheemlicum]NKN31999.1 diguanylate cyclase [Marichromatium bheemlicum]
MNSPDVQSDHHPGQVGTPPYARVVHASHHAPYAPPQTTPEVFVCINAQERIELCDRGVEYLFGHTPTQLHGASWKHLVARQSQQRLSDLLQQLDSSPHPDGIDLSHAGLLGQHHDGALFPIDGRILPAPDGTSGYTLVLRQVPRRDADRSHCPRLEQPLFIELLDRLLQQHRRLNHACALLVIDLDHACRRTDPARIEPLVLTCVQRLQHGRRRQDHLARIGTTRLALLLSDITGQTKVARVAKRIHATLTTPIELAGTAHRFHPRVGFACYPEEAITPEALLAQGEQRCHERAQGALLVN